MSNIDEKQEFYALAVFAKMLEIQTTMLDGLFKQKVKQLFNAMKVGINRFIHSYEKNLGSEAAIECLEDDAHYFIEVLAEAAKVHPDEREAWIQMIGKIKPVKL